MSVFMLLEVRRRIRLISDGLRNSDPQEYHGAAPAREEAHEEAGLPLGTRQKRVSKEVERAWIF